MIKTISTYNNDIITSARITTGIFNPKPTAEFTFISGKKLYIKPTHSVSISVDIVINEVGLGNPRFWEDSTKMCIEGEGRMATSESLAGVKLMRVQTIDLYDHLRNIISSVHIRGDLDCDRLGKRLNIRGEYMAGVVPMRITLRANNLDLPMALMYMSNDIGLIVT